MRLLLPVRGNSERWGRMKKIPKDSYFALAVFLMDYHGGQWSRGYRLLCRLQPSNFSSALMAEERENPIYNYLVDNYATEV